MQCRVDAVVEHRCRNFQQMRVNGSTVESVSYTCLWNNLWTPGPVSAQCNCKLTIFHDCSDKYVLCCPKEMCESLIAHIWHNFFESKAFVTQKLWLK